MYIHIYIFEKKNIVSVGPIYDLSRQTLYTLTGPICFSFGTVTNEHT